MTHKLLELGHLVEEMGLSKEDRILIKNLHERKGYGAERLMKEFPTKEWKKTTLNDFLKDVRQNRMTAADRR